MHKDEQQNPSPSAWPPGLGPELPRRDDPRGPNGRVQAIPLRNDRSAASWPMGKKMQKKCQIFLMPA